MRITLDYYRILSVPIQADSAQLNQAYEDRLQQQPCHEYSEYAVSARKKLLEQAHNILNNAETRAEYDASFFTPLTSDSLAPQNAVTESENSAISPKPLTVSPYIEIEPEILIGALMILNELAEYEIVLRLGTDSLNNEEQAQRTNSSQPVTSPTTTKTRSIIEQKPDILLCLALSYLELSREQWRRDEFEHAAISGQMGLKLLRQEKSLFPRLQAEIAEELNLLKPYRVLELLGKNPPGSSLRFRGLQLLKEMLLQREGIEGIDRDPSGLKSDQFLCFIQQIRTYLTLQEQKDVFLAEAKRGSYPGSCVAAYALIAEGYAQKKPSSILEAQKILQELSDIYNTHWERAICALLLGQTTKSQEIIRQITENNTLELIQKRSENAPDLLPGLCFYGEQWLQQQVLAQFQDLRSIKITLAQYFSDRDVQAYLDQVFPVTHSNHKTASSQSSHQEITKFKKEQNRLYQLFPWLGNKKNARQASFKKTLSGSQKTSSEVQLPQTSSRLAGTKTDNQIQPYPNVSHNSQSIKLVKEHNSSLPKSASIPTQSSLKTKHPTKPGKKTTSPAKSKKRIKRNQKSSASKKYLRYGLFLAGLTAIIGTLGFAVTKRYLQQIVVESVAPSPSSQSTPKTPTVSQTPTVAAIPKVTVTTPKTTAALTTESAHKVIQKWLDSKAAALGQEYQTDRLNSILTDSLLTQWRDSSAYYQQNNIYRQFEHSLKIRSVKINPENSNLATVEAEVKEVARHYQQGQLNQSQSYQDNLVVGYELIRQNNTWLIKNSKVLQSL